MNSSSFSWLRKDLYTFLESITVDPSHISSLPTPRYDLCLVGSGLSSTFTLIEFLSQLNQFPLEPCRKNSCFNIATAALT